MNFTIMPVGLDDQDFALLVAKLDDYQLPLYPAASNHGVPVGALRAARARVWLARAGAQAAGCVCLYLDNPNLPEIKRLFVDPVFRGYGIASALLAGLEDWARRDALPALYLETGIYQMDAVGLYEKHGFVRTGPFGDYQEDPLSIYMRKTVTDVGS
ncbi:GNAT family N-acetyltransferase [Acerihabitans arboris]|uniref:GNAT family N-acetyltransferase n=1 Tax=Acerihabitans arboris TaxID=2691583 RepID=A0A845SN50_9GAMM|nr:GNAT family N-acetyltransferase [Acerihabitans arboris]NDL63978.1 GNAT family N-acetyltransferase [Acerihabitans arboris]